MSVTVLSSPQAYTPSYNSQWFTCVSSQVAQPNFTYTVVVTDLITSTTQTYEIEQRPDTKVVFDASVFSRNFIQDFVPNNEYGWKICEDAVRKIRVNVGETYGSTPVYASGSNTDYIIWNGYVRYLDFPGYDYTDYVYANLTSNNKYLTQLFRKQTSTDKSLFIYALTSQAANFMGDSGDFGTLRVETYDSNNNLLGTSDIANPYANSSTYTDKYLCIDVGHKGLSEISSGLVTGTYPIMTSSVAYYKLYDVSQLGNPSATFIIDLFTVDVICEARHDVYCVHFKDKSGNFETCLFPKVSEINIEAEKKYFRQNQYGFVGDNWVYNTFTEQEVAYSSLAKKKLRLTTDWLTDDQIENYQNIINGRAYLDMGTTIGLIPIKVMTNSYKINKKWNERLYSMSIDIEYSFKEIYV